MRATAIDCETGRALLDWYDRHARLLPWRLPPGSTEPPDPYRIWLAEIMLQQTTVVTAAPYFERFLARWPTVDALAAADDAELMQAWAGLGYYARARNLLAAARQVAAGAGFPRSEAGLRALPGVGPYTAAAIAAIAFGEPATVIDGNIERVVTRLFGISAPLPGARAEIAARLAPLVPADRPGDFAQSLMDLGATVCTPRRPRCLACPLATGCAARASGTPETYPVKPPRRPRPRRSGWAWWIERAGAVALVRRPAHGLLGGMLALPGTGWSVGEPRRHPFDGAWRQLAAPVVHGFTHFELHLDVAMTRVDHAPASLDGLDIAWTPLGRLGTVGLPTLYARAARACLEQLETA